LIKIKVGPYMRSLLLSFRAILSILSKLSHFMSGHSNVTEQRSKRSDK